MVHYDYQIDLSLLMYYTSWVYQRHCLVFMQSRPQVPHLGFALVSMYRHNHLMYI